MLRFLLAAACFTLALGGLISLGFATHDGGRSPYGWGSGASSGV